MAARSRDFKGKESLRWRKKSNSDRAKNSFGRKSIRCWASEKGLRFVGAKESVALTVGRLVRT
jgi:hypothetical protein